MRIYVKVDAEGLPGIYYQEQVLPNDPHFAEYRRIVTDCVNVVGKALKAAGADEVYVKESHGMANGIIWSEVDDSVDLLMQGIRHNYVKLPKIEECDGIVLLGYHAKAGTHEAVLNHTFNVTYQNIYINGTAVGEMAFDGAFAGEAGVPVILVVGDDKTCIEAEQTFPGVVTCCTKESTSFRSAIMPTPRRVYKLMEEKCSEAIKKMPEQKLYLPETPCTIRVEMSSKNQPPCFESPDMKLINGYTYEVTDKTFSGAFRKALKCY